MRKKQRQKRLLVALSAALLLVVTVPIIAAFAGEGDEAVSGSDVAAEVTVDAPAEEVSEEVVSAADSSEITKSVMTGKAEPKAAGYNWDETRFDDPEFWFDRLSFCKNGFMYYTNTEGCTYAGYDAESDSIRFVAPPCSNPINTFRHWKDNQTGAVYTPGETYSISLAEMKRRCINDDGSSTTWPINSVWEGDELQFEETGNIQFDVPTDSDDPLEDDGFNKYDVWSGKTLEVPVTGIYNLRTEKITYSSNYAIAIPGDYIPAYQNYSFVEWNMAMNGGGRGYQPGETFTFNDFNDPIIILYAVFDGYTTKSMVNVSWYDWASGNYGSYAVACDENGNAAELRTPKALTNASGTFAGWKNNVTDEIYPADTLYKNFNAKAASYDIDDDSKYAILLEAVWEGDRITFDRNLSINLNFNGGWNFYEPAVSGTYNVNTDEITFNGDPVFAIPTDVTPDNNDGFEFIGWNTSEYGTGTMYQPGTQIHLKDVENLNRDFYLDLYATFKTDTEFRVVEQSGEVANIVEKVQPSAGLVLVDDVSFDEVRMVVANIADAVKEDVIDAISEQVDIKTDGEDANVQLLDISLVDSQNRGVSIESGKILIIVAYPDIPNAKDYNYTIYHYKDGCAEPIYVEKLDDGLAFYADSFSPYALVWTEEVYEDPDNNDGQQGSNDHTGDSDGQQQKDQPIAYDENGNGYTEDQININIERYSDSEAAKYIALTGEKADNALAYDITITSKVGGKKLTLENGKTLTVKLARPDLTGKYSFNVYHIEGDNAVPVKLSPSTGAQIVFDASGFSPYVLAWHEVTSTGNSPKTGDSFSPVIFILLLVFSVAAAAETVYYNRNKIKNWVAAK